ncbi:Hypothetical protein PBC10988_2330 [Planctomycetales bacterium 10988]|nr:Hypothetical protein PBC10988_2330 [Planctomycetales bacterium 10988]
MTNDSQLIALQRNGQHLILDDALLHRLGDVKVSYQQTNESCRCGYKIDSVDCSLLKSPDGYRLPNAGCLPLLQELADRNGKMIQVVTSPPISPLPLPSAQASANHPILSEYVRNHSNGIISVPHGYEETSVIASLSEAYPQQKMLVLGSKTSRLKRILSNLAGSCVNETTRDRMAFADGRLPLLLEPDQEMPPLVFSTFKETANLDFSTADIVLFLDAKEAAHQKAQEALEVVDARFRLFGLLREDQKVSPYEEGVLMRVFGPERLFLRQGERTQRASQVAWVDHHQPTISMERIGPTFDYRCIWHNERRNREIVKLAKQLSNTDQLDPRKFPQPAQWLSSQDSNPKTITILVDRLDHAVSLGEQLRDWPIIISKSVFLEGYPARVRKRLNRDRRRMHYGTRQIVMTDMAESYRSRPDILLWAGASPYPPSIPCKWREEDRDSNRPLLIVDFLDRFNRQTRKWSKSRKEIFAQQNIFEVGTDPTRERVHRFLEKFSRGAI